MADEVAYVISGSGESLQWEVESEIADRYYARVAKEPTRWEFKADETVYVPQNHQHRYVNTGDEPLRLLIVQNRLIKFLGYDKVAYLEDAPEFSGGKTEAVPAVA
jgi:oxalate decarboxylase/phosphoglucose isomerase-like protein (cupin superfamily)